MIALGILPVWFVNTAGTLLWIAQAVMFMAAVASWLPQVWESKVGYYLFLLTDPMVDPVRRLLRKVPAVSRSPVDISFLLTYLLLLALDWLIRII